MTLAEWIAALPADLRPRFEPMLDPENGLLGVQIAALFELAPPENAAMATEAAQRAWAEAVLARQATVLNVAAPMSMAVGTIFHAPGDEAKIEPPLRAGIAAARAAWEASGDHAYLTLHREGLRQLARWLARRQRAAAAAEAYQAILDLEPENALEWQNLGVIYKNQLNELENARRCFARALDLDPEGAHIARRELAALDAAPPAKRPGWLGRLFRR